MVNDNCDEQQENARSLPKRPDQDLDGDEVSPFGRVVQIAEEARAASLLDVLRWQQRRTTGRRPFISRSRSTAAAGGR